MVSAYEQVPFTDTDILPALVYDYVAGRETIVHLTKYPFEFSSLGQVIADKANETIDRTILVEVLQSQYAAIPTDKAVSTNIESLLSENTFTVVAAHQPCLFMGPLYNIYKISCAINTVKQLQQQYPEYHFVPVFWMGSEDHDVDELTHTYVNGKRIDWSNAGTGASGRWETASMTDALDQLEQAVSQNKMSSVLREGLKQYTTFGKLTQFFVNEIFKAHGLVVLDQDDARLKRKFSKVIFDELLNRRAVEVLHPLMAEMEEAGYKVQAKPRDINFFYLGDNFRERIVLNNSSQRFEVNNTQVSFSREEMEVEIEAHPERFSPNVIFRPLYQEIILPNLAFVGGAGELSYWLELKPLFDHYSVNFPMIVMRNSAVLVHSSVKKKLDKLNLKAGDFFKDIEQLINRYVQEHKGEELSLAEEKTRIAEVYDAVLSKAEAADATLKNNTLAEKQKAIQGLENLESKMLKAEKRKQETSVSQIRGVHAVLFPEGSLQERIENFIPFYSQVFIDSMVNSLDPFSKSFHIFLAE